MNAHRRRERNAVIAAFDDAVRMLRSYIDSAGPEERVRLVGHEPALRGCRAEFERATAPAAAEGTVTP